MDLENKRLYRWLPWVVALAVAGLFIMLLHNELASRERDWQERARVQQAGMQSAIGLAQQDATREASLLAQLVAQDPAVVALVRKAYNEYGQAAIGDAPDDLSPLRAQLMHLLQPYWARMEHLGARELNVHLGPVATVFLRMHQPDRHSDDATQVSPMLVNVLTTHTPAKGMELGHYGANYRAMVPVGASLHAEDGAQGVIEVALPLMSPPPDAHGKLDYAVLLHASVVTDLLWGATRQDVQANSGNLRSPWAIESFSSPLVKDWLAQGLLPEQMAERSEPWMLHQDDKTYLLSVTGIDSFTDPRLPKVAPRVLLLSWNDITESYNRYSAERRTQQIQYLIECLLAEALLWFLFRYNRRHVLQLLREHSEQLQRERDSSEQSRQRLNLALVSSESGFWEWNITNNRAIFSAEWRELCGLPEDDGRADIEEWLVRVHPSDKRTSYTEMIRHIKGETPMFENEYRLRVADGSYKWIFTRGKVVEWLPDGKAALMLGVYSDITERKKNEIIVIRQQAALRALNEIASIPVVDAEDQLRRALATGSRYLGLPSGAVSRVQGHQFEIKVKVGGLGVSLSQAGPEPLSNYFCELTLRNEDVFAQDDISLTQYSRHLAHVQGKIESYIGVPIWLKGKVYGTLYFFSERSRHQPYDELDMDFMRLLARWVGVTLERWQHQSEQQALLDRFDKLCNQLPGFLYQFQLFPNGESLCPYVSAGIYDLYDVTPAEVMGSAAKLFERLHPDDLGWISLTVSQSAQTLTPWIASFRVLNPKRGEIWVHAESRPEKLPDGSVLWHGFIVDITETKRAELRLQEVNSLREAIFDAASIAIISTDIRGVIKTFNQGAERLLGYSSSEVIDLMTPLKFHVPEELQRRALRLSHEFGMGLEPDFEVLIARAREGDEDENEWTYRRKDGTTVPMILSVTALRSPDGEVTGYLALGRDISEIKRIDRLKSEFISTVSHELRTPLTAISGALGIIVNGAAGALPDTANKMLNIAHKNSLRLIHLVNDLLDMEKLVAGKMYFDAKPESLPFIVQQALEQNAAYAAQYQVKFTFNNLAGNDIRVNVDSNRLQQVLANFLSNAAKFSPVGEQVEVRIEKLFHNVRVSVIDKGQGIAEEFRSRIFQKFSQADSSDTRQKGGTGLGLAICKEIIERMGGKIGFYSQSGEGAQFYFDIPVLEPGAPGSEKLEHRHQTGNRLLVVEDDPEVGELLATILRSANYRVDVAHNGQAALERMALYAYQAVTMDLQLPDMDGLQLIKQLRSDASTQRMPIVVISANLDGRRLTRNDPWYAGIKWLQKPQTSASILAAVKSALVKDE